MRKSTKNTNYMLNELKPSDVQSVIGLYDQMRDTWFRREQVLDYINRYPSCGAWTDEILIAFCYCNELAPNLLEIKNIYVDASFQSQSIGSSLLRNIEIHAKSLQYEGIVAVNSLHYDTKIPLLNAERFYKRSGFSIIATFDNTRVFSKAIR